jgi:hypothetical protein
LNARNTACRQLLLLEALCDCFATFTALRKNELGLEGSRCPADFDELMQHEQELLSQLQRVQDGAELEVLELLGAADAGVATIAPRTDPLALLKRHLSLARAENVVSLTPKDVAGALLCCSQLHARTGTKDAMPVHRNDMLAPQDFTPRCNAVM